MTPVYFSDKTVVLKGLDDGTVIVSQSITGAYEGMLVKTEQQAQADKKNAANATEENAN